MAYKFLLKDVQPMSTYVFLHLNTTCLPDDEENDSRITEICLMAINKKSFKERLRYDQNGRPVLPRVINKLVLCVDPRADITDRDMEVSELKKEQLSHQKPFKNYISTMRSFLKQLEEPFCLIGSDGQYFDFAVLRKELERASGFDDVFASMFCVASFDALKDKSVQLIPDELEEKAEIPFDVKEYFEEIFKRKPEDTHTAEGLCKAMVCIAHNTERQFFTWVGENSHKMMDI